jgi:hypothetical protein
MTQHVQGAAATRLAWAVLECTAPITQILDHMARSPNAPDVQAAVATLRTVLEGVLAPLEETVPPADLLRTAEIVDLVTDAIVAEILLVPHPGRTNGATRRRRSRGKRRRPG